MIDLDDAVISALELFRKPVPKVNIKFKRPLVVGSGNAAVTGQVLFNDRDAVFADESTYKQQLKRVKVDGAVLISASGKKHAPIIAKELKKRRIKTVLLTCNEKAPAKKFVGETVVFPKNAEPYSFNVSTYLGMMLSKTRDGSGKILNQIRKLKVPNLKKYNAFFLIIPAECYPLRDMFLKKFSEMFGPNINGRVSTPEQVKHGLTIVNSDKELFISFGYNNKIWGNHRWNIAKPSSCAALMAAGYYIIGRIAKANPPWFKRNIASYCQKMSKVFGQKIEPVVK